MFNLLSLRVGKVDSLCPLIDKSRDSAFMDNHPGIGRDFPGGQIGLAQEQPGIAVATITGPALTGYTLNAVRGVQFPGRQAVEPFEPAFDIGVKGMRVHRRVTNHHVIVGPVRAFVGIQPDFKHHFGLFALVEGQTLIIGAHMTTKAAFAGLRMAHLTGYLAPMDCVGSDCCIFSHGFRVTCLARRPFRQVKPVFYPFGGGMHFTGFVAVHARHVFIRIVHVRFIVLFDPCVFTVNAPPVATGTRGVHGRCFDKPVCGEQTAIGIIRPADMALSATGMAGKAVSVYGRSDGYHGSGIFISGSLLDGLFHRSQGKM